MQSIREIDQTPMHELSRRYWKWEAGGVLLIAIGVVVSWGLLLLLAHWRFGSNGVSVYWLSPAALVWIMPAFFAGILAATWPTDLLYRYLMGDRYEEFRGYQTRKFGYDGRRWMLPFYFICGGLTAALIVLLLDCYVFFGPNSIQVDGLWAMESERFVYDDVIEIRVSDWREGDNGQRVAHYTLALYFADGAIWTSARDEWYSGNDRLRDIAAYVSERSGIPIVEIDVMSPTEL
jgi:hypothetical protein